MLFAIYASSVISNNEEAIRPAIQTIMDEADDDQIRAFATADDVEETFMQLLPVVIAVSAIRILLECIGIFGALNFKANFVAAALVAHASHFIIAAHSLDIGGLLYAAFFAYPHVFFILEAKQGILTRDNYYNEEMSCCCV